MFRIHIFLLTCATALLNFSVTSAERLTLKSPDNQTAIELFLLDGELKYQVTYQNRVFIEPSSLGLETSLGDFTSALTLQSHSYNEIAERYEMSNAKHSQFQYLANTLSVTLANKKNDTLEVDVQVSNNNLAFRYGVRSNSGATRIKIFGESTSFNLPDDAATFITSQALPETGWMQTKPSYEEPYTVYGTHSMSSANNVGYTLPALFEIKSKGWLLISETDLDSRYVGSRLGESGADGNYPLLFPQEGENSGIGATYAAMALPAKTPWRTITVGSDLSPIVETSIPYDLVTPRFSAKNRYKMGRASWSWIVWQDESIYYEDQIKYIDLAADLNLEYVLIDSLWDTQIGRNKIEQLAKYSATKNVELMLWYNSNGWWNDAPQTPQDIMNNSAKRKKEMAWMESIGIKGIKVDFFGGDKQQTIKLYEDIFTDANDFGLLVTVHGSTIPRGWERMYPNFVSSEAVMASENLIFFQDSMNKHALNSTILPFTRNAIGAMDFAPVFLNTRLTKNQDGGTIRTTTDAFELATSIVYQSPIQHFGLTPNNLNEQPKYVLRFLKQVPANWDETKLISGKPADHVAIARRLDDKWYIGVTNGEKQPKTLEVVVPMLVGKQVTIIEDGERLSSIQRQLTIRETGKLTLKLAPQGGAVIYMED